MVLLFCCVWMCWIKKKERKVGEGDLDLFYTLFPHGEMCYPSHADARYG